MPPEDTKLVYVGGSDPETGEPWAKDREYWAGESITFSCIDTTEGIDASGSTTVSFPCRIALVSMQLHFTLVRNVQQKIAYEILIHP